MTDAPVDTAAPSETPAAEPQSLEDVLSAHMSETYDKIEARERMPEKGEDGRFVSKEPKAEEAPAEAAPAEQNTDQPATQDSKPAQPAIAPPHSWSDAEKAWFAELPPERQAYIAKRESEAHQQITRQGEELARYEPIGRVLQPHMPRLSQSGVAPQEYIGRLLNADAALANPQTQMEALKYVADLYRIDLGRLASGQPAASAQGNVPADPALAALYQEIRGVKSWISQQHQQAEAARRAAAEREAREVNAQAQAFLNDPKFPYAKDVREEVASLLIAADNMGKPLTLEDAYNKAVRLNNAVWQKIESEKVAAAKKAADEEAAKKAAEAKRNAPTIVKPRGSAAKAPSSAASWEERMAEAYDRVAS